MRKRTGTRARLDTETQSATAAPEKTESRAPVQVVEVVETEDESMSASEAKAPAENFSTEEETIEAPVPAHEEIFDPIPEPTPETDPLMKDEEPVETPPDEKRTESMVDELFQSSRTPVMPDIDMHPHKRGPKPIVVWAIVTILVALLTGGVITALSQKSVSMPSFGAQPTPTVVPTEMPTPTPELKREDLTVKVFNGGGTVGAASKMKTLLEEKGYKIDSTGNTDEFTFTETEILVKPSKEAYLELLRSDLAEDYTLGTVAATLAEDAEFDAQVTVGK